MPVNKRAFSDLFPPVTVSVSPAGLFVVKTSRETGKKTTKIKPVLTKITNTCIDSYWY